MTWFSNSLTRRAMTLVEVMIASSIAVLVMATAFSSVVFYQKTVLRNDRAAKVANLLESQMELINNQTWYSLENGTNGLFPAGGMSGSTRVTTWPTRTGPFKRYECTDLKLDLVKDAKMNAQYTGLGGKVQVYYTPIVYSHTAKNRSGVTVYYDVRYYKVELVVTLDDSSRVRAGTGADVWTAVTYLSELGGRNDAEFSGRVLKTLRERQRG